MEANHGLKVRARVLKGEGSLITVRGKRNLGYELTAEVVLSHPLKQDATLVLEGICEDEDDCHHMTGTSKHRKALVAAVKEALECFRSQ